MKQGKKNGCSNSVHVTPEHSTPRHPKRIRIDSSGFDSEMADSTLKSNVADMSSNNSLVMKININFR